MPDFHPKDDHLIVKPVKDSTAQGDAETRQGDVVALGPGRLLGGGRPHPLDVKVGERIIYSAASGTELEVDGEAYVELPEDEILALSAE